MASERLVGIVRSKETPVYPSASPYHPGERYPEAPFDDVAPQPNTVYAMVRDLWRCMGLDLAHYGAPQWNPLGEWIAPGSTVVLKPNLVSHVNAAFKVGVTDTDCLVTHGSVLRAVADYVIIALQGRGSIVVGDCPIQATEWPAALRVAGIDGVGQFYRSRGVDLRARDYRLVVAQMDGGYLEGRSDQNTADDYVEIDLADRSLLMPIIHHSDRFAVSDHDIVRMRRVHNAKVNKYLIPKDVLNAECVINLPKMKSHVKAGVTLSLKNLVGIIGHKDYLPHFRLGSPRNGSDEYPHRHAFEPLYYALHHRLWRMDSGLVKRLLYHASRGFHLFYPWEERWEGSGGWYGNDTLWRTILDINRAFFYGDPSTGRPTRGTKRRYLTVVDGIIGGDHEGPLAPRPVPSGMLLAGANPAAVDYVSTWMMGYDPEKVPAVRNAFQPMDFPIADFEPADVQVASEHGTTPFTTFKQHATPVRFIPSSGWRGRVEQAGPALSD
jgi:uncharacterized protein (DUF362 family)